MAYFRPRGTVAIGKANFEVLQGNGNLSAIFLDVVFLKIYIQHRWLPNRIFENVIEQNQFSTVCRPTALQSLPTAKGSPFRVMSMVVR